MHVAYCIALYITSSLNSVGEPIVAMHIILKISRCIHARAYCTVVFGFAAIPPPDSCCHLAHLLPQTLIPFFKCGTFFLQDDLYILLFKHVRTISCTDGYDRFGTLVTRSKKNYLPRPK